MTDMATGYRPELEKNDSSVSPAANATETQTLITEQQVLFSSAAAVALPPAKTRRWSDAIHAVASAVGSWVANAAKPPTQPVYPKRRVWLENALMSREMDRL
jgi:hypothetical protein